jgi:hypothetical protein
MMQHAPMAGDIVQGQRWRTFVPVSAVGGVLSSRGWVYTTKRGLKEEEEVGPESYAAKK